MRITRDRTGRPERWNRHYAWTVATALLVLCGAGVSVAAAGAVARSEANTAHHAFEHEATEIAETLERAVKHQEDLAIDAGGLLADPRFSQTAFLRWVQAARVLERHPQVAAVGLLKLVKHSELAAFSARALADPPGPLPSDGTYGVVPAGIRPFYCLSAAGVTRVVEAKLPAGFDVCAVAKGRTTLLATRDSGEGLYMPNPIAVEPQLVVQTPVYRGQVKPLTLAARRASFAGWVVTLLDPTLLLNQTLQNHPNMSVELRHQAGGTDVTFAGGAETADAASETIDMRHGWTVVVSGPRSSVAEPWGSPSALLLTGIAMSVLLGVLLYVLGTGRERARRQLKHRTRQLRHQALHDALTGLPNRALLMDRLEHMLIRQRRDGTVGAALFLDLDDFKSVNDTLGHHAGDQLLIAVAGRLASTLRGADTIARMGGDEFVVLLQDTTTNGAPEVLAQRLLEVMRAPFELGATTRRLVVHMSIGIATSDRGSADDLLRDADTALYQAKADGKDRYAIFSPSPKAPR